MPDAAIPIFQTVNENGEATLEVEAVIKALGLILKEASEPQRINSVQWVDSTSVVREHISGLFFPGGSIRGLEFGIENEPVGHGTVDLITNTGGYTTLLTQLQSSFGNTSSGATIFNSGSQSSFLQVAGQADQWTCNFGQGSFLWPSAVAEVATTFSHGLGIVPTMVLAIPQASAFISCTLTGLSATTATLNFRSNAGAIGVGTTIGYGWFGIG